MIPASSSRYFEFVKQGAMEVLSEHGDAHFSKRIIYAPVAFPGLLRIAGKSADLIFMIRLVIGRFHVHPAAQSTSHHSARKIIDIRAHNSVKACKSRECSVEDREIDRLQDCRSVGASAKRVKGCGRIGAIDGRQQRLAV